MESLTQRCKKWKLLDELMVIGDGVLSDAEREEWVEALRERLDRGLTIIEAGQEQGRDMAPHCEKWETILHLYQLAHNWRHLRLPV